MRTFMFEGDCFAADCISCICRRGNTVKIFVQQDDEPAEYDFDDEESAKSKQTEAIRAWKAA